MTDYRFNRHDGPAPTPDGVASIDAIMVEPLGQCDCGFHPVMRVTFLRDGEGLVAEFKRQDLQMLLQSLAYGLADEVAVVQVDPRTYTALVESQGREQN